ncbi:PREDICTED: myeloma-overexpressed gene 2 protein isoform X1 [Myotis brandtii]|uniref:myeloma-overexpressed gene 2 protein isoform X1 n=1 Tax=Myotis brandtii TaxID=109478 RepID=UPI000703D19E|nr:PREDICTED: myeloma-overexpressed gene 2 protein isoform X1 [Myotis brandtii]
MKPAVDEMFPEGAGPYVDLDEAGGSTGLLMDLAANEKAVHSDFFNGACHYKELLSLVSGSYDVILSVTLVFSVSKTLESLSPGDFFGSFSASHCLKGELVCLDFEDLFDDDDIQ